MKTSTRNALRYFFTLLLIAVSIESTFITLAKVFPGLFSLWAALALIGLAAIFPIALWLHRRMP